jgi:hydrogenase maturation protease
MKNSIAVIGLGNLILGDEGFGVHLIQYLEKSCLFQNVDIIDGGTIGFRLIEYFMEYNNLIFVDALRIDDKAGTIYKFSLDELPPNVTFVSSIHEIGLGDVVQQIKFMGKKIDATVVGIVPLSVCPNELTEHLSDFMKERIEPVANIVLEEVKKIGGRYARRSNS